MTQSDLLGKLDQLMATWENEVVEFKQAGKDYDTDKIGAYFSALANEANLRGLDGAGLIEGRKPSYHVSAEIAAATDAKVKYIRTRAQDDDFYTHLLIGYLQKFRSATRADIDDLLLDKLSDALDDEQKANKINNLLTKLRRNGVIVNQGSRRLSSWVLAEKIAEKK